jgi:DNA-binding transcriptional MerR regulator
VGGYFSVPLFMVTGSYSIEELAEETGFDKRVIRSFVEQGLLCGPDSRGRYARYTGAHLTRLKAIRHLRDHLQMNLAEIRAALLSMTEEDIMALSTRSDAGELSGKQQQSSSVLDYLRRVRQDGQEPVPDKTELPEPDQRLSAVDRLMTVLKEDLSVRHQSRGKSQLWHRFAVTPDIELAVRGLADGGQVEQWERIADCLREILLGGTRNEQ